MAVIDSSLFVVCVMRFVHVLGARSQEIVTDIIEENRDADSNMKFIGVFKSLQSVKECLNKEQYKNLPEVQELLSIFDANYSVKPEEEVDRSQRKVFIVLEGIDASGKATISQRMSKLISGRQLSTPPPALLHLRTTFDAHGIELRYAYYSLGNYLAAQQVRNIYTNEPVIMDRFWHSTASYAIAHQVVNNYSGSMPAEGHQLYEWPRDLLRPDIVFFLSVSESKRIDRLMRNKEKPLNREQIKMIDDKTLRDALKVIFLKMRNPNVNFYNNDYFRTTMTRLTAYLEHYSTTLTF